MNTPNSALARRPALRLSLLACVAALCTACETLAPVPKVDVLPTTPPDLAPMAHAAPASAGSLFRTSAYRPAFEPRRPRRPGPSGTRGPRVGRQPVRPLGLPPPLLGPARPPGG